MGNDKLWLIHFLLLWWHPASDSRTSLLGLIFLVCLHCCLESCAVCTDLLIALYNSSILSCTYWSLNKQYNWGRGTLWFTLVLEVNATHNRPQHTPHVTNYILWRICKHIASNSDKIFKLLPHCSLPHYYSLTYSHCPPLLFTNNLFFFRYPLHGSSHIIPQNPHNSHLPRTPHLTPHTSHIPTESFFAYIILLRIITYYYVCNIVECKIVKMWIFYSKYKQRVLWICENVFQK